MRVCLFVVCLSACGSAAVRVETAAPIPDARADRDQALHAMGKRVYRLLKRGEPARLLLDDAELNRVLDPNAATRARALRPAINPRLNVDPARFRALESAEFSGVCLQGARQEPAGAELGLQQPGWVFERVLVIGTQPGGRRVASWVEGAFVFTNAGFEAIALTRVEPPRWEHSDLELTTCDMEVGVSQPLDVVVVTE